MHQTDLSRRAGLAWCAFMSFSIFGGTVFNLLEATVISTYPKLELKQIVHHRLQPASNFHWKIEEMIQRSMCWHIFKCRWLAGM